MYPVRVFPVNRSYMRRHLRSANYALVPNSRSFTGTQDSEPSRRSAPGYPDAA